MAAFKNFSHQIHKFFVFCIKSTPKKTFSYKDVQKVNFFPLFRRLFLRRNTFVLQSSGTIYKVRKRNSTMFTFQKLLKIFSVFGSSSSSSAFIKSFISVCVKKESAEKIALDKEKSLKDFLRVATGNEQL